MAHSTSSLFNCFLGNHNWQLTNGKISISQKNELDDEIEKNMRVLEFGIPLRFSSKLKESKLRSLLKSHGFSAGNYIIVLDNGDCLLDYRIYGLLYDEINQILDTFNGIANKKDEEHARWLKREGEEFYFYLCVDELIAKVLLTTLNEYEDEDGNKRLFALCPLSNEHIKLIDRFCYTEILCSSIEATDGLGYEIKVKDGKQIIHFSKMPLKEAFNVCKKIIEQEPLKYPSLEQAVDSIEKKYKF